jgi:uncharacterized protein YecT (DUF1311 family)
MLLQPAYAAGGKLNVTPAQINEKTPTYTIELSYPRSGQAAIDREIESWAKNLAREFAEDAKDQGPGQIGPWSAELSYEVVRNDAGMFSVLFTYYTFSGGAHPNSVFETFDFLMPDAMRVEVAELFTRAGIERISAISIAELRRALAGPDGMSDTDWIEKGAGPNPRNFVHFVLQPKELAIYFDAYHVAAYAAGPQEVHIPLAKLNGTLRPDPRAPAASFDCARAQSDIERAICGDRELARLDRHVAEAYFNKLAWEAEETGRFALRKDQRAWLAQRDGCRVRAESFAGCLTRVYQARLKALEGSA